MVSDGGASVPGPNRDYYSEISYWNYFELVYRILNRRATGDKDVFWYDQLLQQGRRFHRGLILNCGNGWLERHLLKIGLIERSVGIDISATSIDHAVREAADQELRAEYVVMDVNMDELPEGPFDFVLNYAAVHHVAYIDRVLRAVYERMSPNGLYVNWDYVGPHRNQYNTRQWEAAWEVNRALPKDLRQSLVYPHLPTMLVEDPTEAVHSELIRATTDRYFQTHVYRPLGGVVGYLLLTHNMPFYERPLHDVMPWLEYVMSADEDFLQSAPEESLFAYFIATPNESAPSESQLQAWRSEEDEREAQARHHNGEYYPRTMLSEYAAAVAERENRRHLVEPEPRRGGRLRNVATSTWPRLAARYERLRHRDPAIKGSTAQDADGNGKRRPVAASSPDDPPPQGRT